MTDRLPAQLLALFQPRPPLRYLPPNDHAPEARTTGTIDGVASFIPALQEKKEQAKNDVITESHIERADREKHEKQEKQKWLMTEGYKQLYKPTEDENVRGDAFKTLFVGRLPYDASTKDLEKEFSRFGPIERIRIVQDRSGKPGKDGKSRGYSFVLFERESDCKTAYKECEHLLIRGRRVLVDVERGRTVSGWRPRRFGGGLGGRHYTKVSAGPKPGFGFPGPGFRGGFNRGGFDPRIRGGRGPGFRGGGGGGYGGGRGGLGFQNGAPNGAPSGPRQGGGGRQGNANYEPLPPRGNYRDRDRDFSSGQGQKRPYDGGYDDPRQRRRY